MIFPAQLSGKSLVNRLGAVARPSFGESLSARFVLCTALASRALFADILTNLYCNDHLFAAVNILLLSW